MTGFTDLPPELILPILKHLPIQTIHVVESLSTSFRKVVSENENVIYRSAASLHGFIPQAAQDTSNLAVEDFIKRTPAICDWLFGVETWKEFCRRHFLLEHSWKGTLPEPYHLLLPLMTVEAAGRHVHRFKVDEVERTVISSSGHRGGLIVASLDSMEVLWFLPSSYVVPYAHVEYDNGFIVFTRHDNAVDVWRRSADTFNEETYLPCTPHPSQIAASPDPVPQFPATYPPIYDETTADVSTTSLDPPRRIPRRGAYLPFALLQHDVETRASRFVYPNLVIASESAQVACIWDVPTSRLVQTLDIKPPPTEIDNEDDCRLSYVDISKDHVFVSWGNVVAVYARNASDPSTNVVFLAKIRDAYDLSPDILLGGYPTYRDDGSHEDAQTGGFHPPPSTQITQCSRAAIAPSLMQVLSEYMAPEDSWGAIHVSPDGQDIVATTTCGWVVYIPNFVRTDSSSTQGFRVFLGAASLGLGERGISYMAFDGIRILIAAREGLYSITVKDLLHPPDLHSMPPNVQQILKYPPYRSIQTSCIQLLRNSAFLSYPVFVGGRGPDIRRDYLAYIDFTNIHPFVPAQIEASESWPAQMEAP